MRNGK